MIELAKLFGFRIKRWWGRQVCARQGHLPETIREDAGPSGLWIITRCPRCRSVLDVDLAKPMRRRVA